MLFPAQEKTFKKAKKVLTNGWWSGILSKLSRAAAEAKRLQKKLTNFVKNKLTRWKPCVNIMTVPPRDVYLVN